MELDLNYLDTCSRYKLFPTFLRFKLANTSLKNSITYKECQVKLLLEEIKIKTSELKTKQNGLKLVYDNLKSSLSFLDFGHIHTIITNTNDKAIKLVELTQNNKLEKLSIGYRDFEPGKLIYNFSSHVLTDAQTSLLSKGLNFAIPPKRVKYENYLLPFEILFRGLKCSREFSNEDLDFTKSKLKDIVLTSYRFYNKKNQSYENITKEEHAALLELISLENVIIQKSDKGNAVVLVDKEAYDMKMNSILGDEHKFVKLNIHDKKIVQVLIEIEDRIKKVLNPLKNKGVLSNDIFNKIMPIGSQPGRMYGLCKAHKESVDGHKPFRPILSAINTPTYQLAKFLIPILEPLTKNEFVTKDSFTFSEDIRKQNVNHFMASFDVDSLFTNIPLNETINICVEKLYIDKNMTVNGFNKQEFQSLLELATKESLFVFNKEYFRQIDGVAMGSPLGPTLANIFLCHYEEKWLNSCPKQFKPTYYRRYVDDIFCLFENAQQVNKFQRFLNSKHINMNFSKEIENNSCLSFLDICITKEETFKTSIYRKPTFSGIYLNFKSFVPFIYKKGLIFCLLHRVYSICSDWKIIHHEINVLKCMLIRNKYPLELINRCIHTFLAKLFIDKPKLVTVPKKEFTVCLPFLGKETLLVKRKLEKLFSLMWPAFKLRVVLNSGIKIGSLFNFKDNLPFGVRSFVVYKYTCGDCYITYIGKTTRHLLVRMSEHLGISFKTGAVRKYHEKQTTAIREHIRSCKHTGDVSNFSVLANARNDFELLVKESLLIGKEQPVLNKQIKNFQLSLF